jgi:hypothetical protein
MEASRQFVGRPPLGYADCCVTKKRVAAGFFIIRFRISGALQWSAPAAAALPAHQHGKRNGVHWPWVRRADHSPAQEARRPIRRRVVGTTCFFLNQYHIYLLREWTNGSWLPESAFFFLKMASKRFIKIRTKNHDVDNY